MIDKLSSHRIGAFFLFGLGPLVSLIYLVACEDPLLGTERDFSVFWTAGALAAKGDIATIFNPSAFEQALANLVGSKASNLPFLYAPNSLLYFVPLSFVPPLAGLIIWLIATFSLMTVMLWPGLVRPRAMMAALLLCPASTVNIICGQNAYLSTALLGGALLLLEKRPVLAGVLLGLLSYKPQFGLMLPLLLLGTGNLRAFSAATMTTLALLFATTLFFGTEVWASYLQGAAGLRGFVDQWNFISYTFYMAFLRYGLAGWQAGLIHATAALFTIAATIWIFRQSVPHTLKCSIAMVGVTLVAPYFLPYDMTIISAAILLALPSFIKSGWERFFLGFIWVLPALAFEAGTPAGPILIMVLFLLLLRQALIISAVDRPGMADGGAVA
jgi:hypothetical protein